MRDTRLIPNIQVDALETLAVPIIIHDDVVIHYLNAAALRMLRYRDGSDLLGRDLYDIVKMSHPRAASSDLGIPQADDKAYMGVDVTFAACDGTAIPAKADGAPILISEGPLSVMIACELPRPGA